jgi:hypothetical protein
MPVYSEPTVVWRLHRGPTRAHATIFSGQDLATVSWFFDGTMDRVENYDTLDLALARADYVKGALIRDGWVEDEPPLGQ